MNNKIASDRVEKLGNLDELIEATKVFFDFYEWEKELKSRREIGWAVIKGSFITTAGLLVMKLFGYETNIPAIPWIMAGLTIWLFCLYVILSVFQMVGSMDDVQQLSQENLFLKHLFKKSPIGQIETARYVCLLEQIIEANTEVYVYHHNESELNRNLVLPHSYLEEGFLFKSSENELIQVSVNKDGKNLDFYDFWRFDLLSGTRTLIPRDEQFSLKSTKEEAY